VIRDRAGRVDELLADALDAGFLAGVPLGRWYPELSDCFLVAVTEKRTRAEIDALAAAVSKRSYEVGSLDTATLKGEYRDSSQAIG
jgi:hypothetical protein